MKRIAYSAAAGAALLLQGCATLDEVPTSTSTYASFYAVQLVCPAAPQIGCGSAAKPLLLELERQPGVKEAWLNRAGTLIAIVWKAATSVRQRMNASRITKGEELSRAAAGQASADFLARSNKWFRAAALDRLSEEEAEIIAARLVRRTQTNAALPNDTAAALQRLIAESTKRSFIDPENNPREAVEAHARASAKKILDERQFAAFQQAYSQGLRPLPNEP